MSRVVLVSLGARRRAEAEGRLRRCRRTSRLVGSWIAGAERVTVLTGAGISTDSGIPDFRGPQGVWTKNPTAEKTSTLQHYLADPDVRRTAWKMRVESPLWSAQPNAGHRAIVDIERAGKLHGVVTQNIDELHQKAGTDPELVIEVHGTAWWTRCMSCGDRRPMAETLERVRGGDEDPPCLVCGGILKSDTISFGQSLVPEVIDRAMAVSRSCDVLLAVGSTLSVYPAASCVPLAAAAGANVAIINGGRHRDGRGRRGGAARADLRVAAGRRRRGEGRPTRDLSRSHFRPTGRLPNAPARTRRPPVAARSTRRGSSTPPTSTKSRTWSTGTTPTSTSSCC